MVAMYFSDIVGYIVNAPMMGDENNFAHGIVAYDTRNNNGKRKHKVCRNVAHIDSRTRMEVDYFINCLVKAYKLKLPLLSMRFNSLFRLV